MNRAPAPIKKAPGLPAELTRAPLRTVRPRDLEVYTQPRVQLLRLRRLGLLHRMTAGYYAIVPTDRIGTDWMPTIEGAAAGIAAADFGEDNFALMGLTAARMHRAIPRAVAFAVVAAPRNAAIAANADPAFHDEGLCGPVRTDLADRTDLCGAFRVPSLRNVALRTHFFHNGVFTSLEQAVRFSVQRDTDPQLWYPGDAQGQVTAYDDLPAPLRANVTRVPPYDRAPGQAPALTDSEIADVVAFLGTLTDGYAP